MRVRIDLNIRVRGNRTLADFDDVDGDAADLHIGQAVTVYEPESGLRGEGSVVEVDPTKQVVILAVDWPSLRPEEAWAEWDAGVAAMLAGAEERRKQPAKVDDLDELRARLERLKAEREA
ncbi:hypothetical protein [Streptomyces sp.]|uniref:hypothetical protein n=1 Tax=Streptomyces sp. TaxID=1931 RepID=UPI002F91E80F